MRDMMHVRMDLVLLLILNGNDYLPKLRGSAGFNKLFHAYLRMLREWIERNNHDAAAICDDAEITEVNYQRPFFLSDDHFMRNENGNNANNHYEGISFNLPFCISFFRELANNAPQNLARREQMRPIEDSFTPLSSLYRFIDSGFLPPCEFQILPSEKEGHETVRLMFVGANHPGWNNVSEFEVDHREKTNMQSTKQRLAHMALASVLGPDWEESINDEKADYEEAFPWETDVPAESDVEQYLGGLLWNLQTYQDGICANYGYNYGRRMAPTAKEVANFFELQAEVNSTSTGRSNSNKLGRRELIGDAFVDPLDAGLSCLAAIPNKASHLIPPPYNAINETTVDEIYVACMDAACNIFDVDKFRRDCLKEVKMIDEASNNKNITSSMSMMTDDCDDRKNNNVEAARANEKTTTATAADDEIVKAATKQQNSSPKGRTIFPRTKHWTVFSVSREPLRHPFEPPQPISDGISRLKRNRNIRVSYVPTTTKPKWMTVTDDDRSGVGAKPAASRRNKRKRKPRRMDNFVNINNIVNRLGKDSIRDFEYKTAYSDAKTSTNVSAFEKEVKKAERSRKKLLDKAEYARTAKSLEEDTERGTSISRKEKHGLTALSTLNELVQAQKIFCKPEWDTVKVPKARGAPRCELIYLKVGPPNGEWKKTYEATRVEYDKIRSVKHQLASAALDEFVGDNWRDLMPNDMEPRDVTEISQTNMDKDSQSNIENFSL
uniref:Xrn1 N-terminal domain-containing protein n=1 Tax=Leptocylindrus danicus TaxID=163516 RepID=A0A7S2KJF7_9STRA